MNLNRRDFVKLVGVAVPSIALPILIERKSLLEIDTHQKFYMKPEWEELLGLQPNTEVRVYEIHFEIHSDEKSYSVISDAYHRTYRPNIAFTGFWTTDFPCIAVIKDGGAFFTFGYKLGHWPKGFADIDRRGLGSSLYREIYASLMSGCESVPDEIIRKYIKGWA